MGTSTTMPTMTKERENLRSRKVMVSKKESADL